MSPIRATCHVFRREPPNIESARQLGIYSVNSNLQWKRSSVEPWGFDGFPRKVHHTNVACHEMLTQGLEVGQVVWDQLHKISSHFLPVVCHIV
jgi:xylose isomerase